MVILFLQNGGNSPQKKFNYIINIYFWFSKKVDKVYDDLKDWIKKISNKFDLGVLYVSKIGIIRIKFLNFYSWGVTFYLSNLWF